MHLVRSVTPEVYWEKWRAFDEMANFLDLKPVDRNLAWREYTRDDDWHEWPVPIQQFLADPFYVGQEVVVRPIIKEFLSDFWEPSSGYQVFVFIGGIGAGKAGALTERIPTPTGWTTFGEVEVGDYVLDQDGLPTRVKWTSPTWRDRPLLRVTFDDGSTAVVDAEHEWDTLTLTDRKRLSEQGITDWRDGWERAQTKDMLEIASRMEASNGQAWHAVPNTRPLDLPDQVLPVEPYTLGAWLGDGVTVHGALTSADPELVGEIERRGQPMKVRASTAARVAPTYQMTGLAPRLREAKVLGLKHVPPGYLRASRRQRLDLLRGLMDTDGFVERNGTVGIDLCDERLARDVRELVVSLGWKCSLRAGPTCGPNATEGGIRWRMRFTPDECPFLLTRKAQRWSPSKQAIRATARCIVSVEPVGTGDSRCIEVESERHLFLVGDGMVPTHNSFSAALSLAYGIYALGCLKRPAKYLSGFPGVQLSNDAEIVFMNASAAGAAQAGKIVYGETRERIIKSPWFKTHYEPYSGRAGELDFPNRVRLSPGTSQWRTALGWNVYGFVVDEAAFGIESERADYVKELFSALDMRRRSRFGQYGFGGLFTSPGSEYAFVEVMAGEGISASSVMTRRTTTWDAKDELKPGAPIFLMDRHSDVVKILETDLTYVEPGVAQRKDGTLVRYENVVADVVA